MKSFANWATRFEKRREKEEVQNIFMSRPEDFVDENGRVIKRVDALPGLATMYKQLKEA